MSFEYNQMASTEPSMDHNLQRPIKEGKLQKEPKVGNVSSRCTRSQADPDWSLQEMHTLVGEVAAIELDFKKALPSHQKWKMVTEYCNSFGVIRSLNQCRKKWDTLVVEYKKIRDWEFQSGSESYWTLESERKIEYGLSVSFDQELFESINKHFKAQADPLSTGVDSDSELDVIIDSGSKKKRRCHGPGGNKIEERDEMIVKLREQAELIQAILRGDLTESKCNINDDSKNSVTSQTEIRRWQGSELIKVFGGLAGTIDQVLDIVQQNA